MQDTAYHQRGIENEELGKKRKIMQNKPLGNDTVSGCKRQGLVTPGTKKLFSGCLPVDVTLAVRRE